MSKMEMVVCDKCGKEIEAWRAKQDSAKLQVWGPDAYRAGPGQRFDLCEECYNKFIQFLETDN